MTCRILFIGLDSADPECIRAWIEEGKLPNLARLRASGAWGSPEGPRGLGSGALWPSLCTGVTPAVHGRYFFQQLARGSYQTVKFESDDLHFPMFWDELSRHGKRIAVIDIPKMRLSPDLNGLQLIDWMVHDADPQPRSVPPELVEQVWAAYGTDPIGDCDGTHRTIEDFRELRDGLLQKVDAKTRFCVDQLSESHWDLFMAVYGETHCVAHQLWHAHDRSMPNFDPALATALGDPVLEIYRAIDEGVGRMIEAAGPDATIMLFAGPGMGPNFSGNYVLDEILQRLENGPMRTMTGAVELLRKAWRKLPLKFRKKFRRAGSGTGDGLMAQLRSHRRCFTLPHNDLAGAIRINLVGREPNGLVRPGAEYDAYCADLTRKLMEIVNVETGRPIVREVMRTRDVFTGPFAKDLPDLLVHWVREAPIREIASPRIGRVRGSAPHRSGDHHAACIFYATGPTVRRGEIKHGLSVMDFPATIAALLGIRMEGLNGVVLPEFAAGSAEPKRQPAGSLQLSPQVLAALWQLPLPIMLG